MALAVVLPLAAGCGTGGVSDEAGDPGLGKELFVNGAEGKQSCASCHTLADAGAKGTIGPDLDAAFGPARQEGFKQSTIQEIVRDQIKYPADARASPDVPPMPANLVEGADLDAVAAYVAQCAGNPDKTTCPGPAGGGTGDSTDGKTIFTSTCGGCHTLADAGTSGTTGPNLDQAKPSRDLVVTRVTNGKGQMPSFKGTLSDAQIKAVAEYVSKVAGK